MQVTYEVDALFGRIFVVDEGPLRHLRFGRSDAINQTVIDRTNVHRVAMPYLRIALFATQLTGVPRRALVVGLGGGGCVRALRQRFPALRIDAVEVDPTVVRVARTYFDAAEDDHLRIYIDDAAAFFERLCAAKKPACYDIIVLDAYDGPEIPPHLTTRAFYLRAARQLSCTGVALANVSSTASAGVERAISKRFARAFDSHCVEVQVPEDDNHVFLGARHPLPPIAELLRLAHAPDLGALFVSNGPLDHDRP